MKEGIAVLYAKLTKIERVASKVGMDPLSITTAIITMLGALTTTKDYLDRFRSRKDVHIEILSMLNTVRILFLTIPSGWLVALILVDLHYLQLHR